MQDRSKERAPAKRHKAVALDYKPADDAPKIVASGFGAIADRILAEAFAAGVAVREDPELVEILAAYDIGSFIPLEAFTAVAEILHFLYLSNRTMAPRQAAAFPPGAYRPASSPPRGGRETLG